MPVEALGRQWRSAAACRLADPELFFPISSSGRALEQVAEAKRICARCPVQRECLAFALGTREVHGVWGGLSEQERQLIWRRDSPGTDRGPAERRPHRLRPDDVPAPGSLAGQR